MDYKLKYIKYKEKYLILKNTINNQSGGSNVKHELYLFKAEWCDHCKNFKPDWEKLKNDKHLNNKVEFITMDSNENAKEIKEWQIEGFPTIILKKGDEAIEYKGSRSRNDIVKFINSNTN